jgi:hypothetical protein
MDDTSQQGSEGIAIPANIEIGLEDEVADEIGDMGDPYRGRDIPHPFEQPRAQNRPAGRRFAVGGSVAAGGSVSSHGSAAVFGRTTRRTIEQIIQDEVIVRKGDRGVSGSKIFVSNRTSATQALPVKFLGSFHLLSKNAAGENNQKAKHIQDQFVSNLDVVKKLVERVNQYDMKTPFMIPSGYSDTVGVNGWEDRWDLAGEIIDLTAHWGKLSLDHCSRWQQDFNGYCDDVDHVSSIWSKDLVSNSMDPELRKVVDEQYSKLDPYQQGGITFLKITLDSVFKMSSLAEESLKTFIKDFGRNGLAKVSHENVRAIATQVDGVAERLADSGLLRSESLTQYVNGFTICSVEQFKRVFLNRSVEFTYLDATGESSFSSMSSAEVLAKIKEISTAAKAIYDHLNLGNKWNLPGKAGHHANIVNKCDNCGALDHLSPKCPKPRDEDKCKKAREARAKARDADGGRGGRGRGGRDGRGGGAGRGERAPWSDSTAKGANSANSGVANIDGTWKMHCSKCEGWNDTHTTKYHDEQQRSAATFKVPPHHPYWFLSGKVYPAVAAAGVTFAPTAGAAGGGAGTASMTGSMLSSLTGVVDRAITTTENAEMSSFLGELRSMMGN